MHIIEPFIVVESDLNGINILKKIEKAGRTAYKSEDRINENSCKLFVKKIIESGHESVIEHESITVRIVCDRGITHEIVRHRIASYTQESTRYCNYSNDKFGNELTFIKPIFWHDNSAEFSLWKRTLEVIEHNYMNLVKLGASPQEARSILPNSLKTEIIVTMNLREWRHFLKLRSSKKAHPQMQQIAKMILSTFRKSIPVIFNDIPEWE